jgi:hypothetical protein
MQQIVRSGKWVRQGTRAGAFAALGCAFYVTGCGGDSSGAGANACGIAGCGGDIKGTWDVTAICVSTSSLAIQPSGVAACDAVANEAVKNAKVNPMPMMITFTDTDYTLSGTAQFEFNFVYTKACLTAQGGSGATQATCNALQMGLSNNGLTGTCMLSGETCACNVTQSMAVNEQTTYHVDGTKLVTSNESSPFCVKGDTAQFSSANSQIGGAFSLKRAAAQTP